jgi:hypothetical protein
MKPFIISQNSWHFWIIQKCGYGYDTQSRAANNSLSICDYIKTLFGCFFWLALVLMALSCLLIPSIVVIARFIQYMLGYRMGICGVNERLCNVGGSILLSISGLVIFLFSAKMWSKNNSTRRQRRSDQPTFVKMAWTTITQKICVPVQIE